VPNFAANLSTLFTELPFLERFAAASAAGFEAVEFQFAYDFAAAEIASRLATWNLVPVLFNLSPGDFAKGERGLAAMPGREAEFMATLDTALDYARMLGCRRLHALAGTTLTDRARQEGVYIANLRRAADIAARDGITLLIEPLNAHDNPGYFLNTTAQAVQLLDRIGRDNVSLQLDLYHCQMTEGDLARHLGALYGRYDHVQVAGVPGRNEPDRGEINYPYLFDLLDGLGYGGYVGCEYRPVAGTVAGLGWARRWGIGGP
jgi:hydroxypyruvate isomerase